MLECLVSVLYIFCAMLAPYILRVDPPFFMFLSYIEDGRPAVVVSQNFLVGYKPKKFIPGLYQVYIGFISGL